MSENISAPEEPKFTREQVVDAFKKFPQKGITNPDDLDLKDGDVINAYALLQVWVNGRKKELGEATETDLEFNFERSTIFVDAGFSDPRYLDEVAHDWLVQDLQAAQEAGQIRIAELIEAKIDEIELKLKY